MALYALHALRVPTVTRSLAARAAPEQSAKTAVKTEKIVLTALCGVVCAEVAKMVVGVVGLARHQDIPVLAAIFELLMFLGAGLIPLLSIWFFADRKRKWLYVIWTPCILYVSFLAINYARVSPAAGVVRFLVWSVIAVLFLHASKRVRPADP